MTEPNPMPQYDSLSRETEYQDPHFHDEDLEIQVDDARPRPSQAANRKKVNRRPPPPRRYYED